METRVKVATLLVSSDNRAWIFCENCIGPFLDDPDGVFVKIYLDQLPKGYCVACMGFDCLECLDPECNDWPYLFPDEDDESIPAKTIRLKEYGFIVNTNWAQFENDEDEEEDGY